MSIHRSSLWWVTQGTAIMMIMTMGIIMKVGVFWKTMFCLIQSQQNRDTKGACQAQKLSTKSCSACCPFQLIQLLWPSSLRTPIQNIYFYQSKAKQSNQDFPTISTILTEKKINYQGCLHPVTSYVGFSSRRAVASEGSFHGFRRVPQSFLYSQGYNPEGSTYCWEGILYSQQAMGGIQTQ